MDKESRYFFETEDGEFIIVDEYGEPILDENGKNIEYDGEDRYKTKDRIYIIRDKRNNYTRDYMDKKPYKKNNYKKNIRYKKI